MRVTPLAPATAAAQIRCSRAKSETCLARRSSSSESDPCSMSQRTRPSGPFDRCVSSSRSALGTAVNPSYPRPWANRITRWRANPGSLGKIGHRSETGARVIGEQRARGSQFVQSPVDCLGNRSVCSRRSLFCGVFLDARRPEFTGSILAPVPGWTPPWRPSRRL
jgi:hypothetical protein